MEREKTLDRAREVSRKFLSWKGQRHKNTRIHDDTHEKQFEYNQAHHVTPQSIIKKISVIQSEAETEQAERKEQEQTKLARFAKSAKSEELQLLIADLENQMDLASQSLDFERAIKLRDEIDFLKSAR